MNYDNMLVLESGYFNGKWEDYKAILKHKWKRKGFKSVKPLRLKTDTPGLKMYVVYGLHK